MFVFLFTFLLNKKLSVFRYLRPIYYFSVSCKGSYQNLVYLLQNRLIDFLIFFKPKIKNLTKGFISFVPNSQYPVVNLYLDFVFLFADWKCLSVYCFEVVSAGIYLFKINNRKTSRKMCEICLKDVFATFLLVYFLTLNELGKLGKMFFISLQKFYSFSKSNFRILHFQISWRHEKPKHKTSTFNWITGEVNTVSLMKFSQFKSYFKRKNFIKKFYENSCLETFSRPFCVCKELKVTSATKR